MARKPKQEADDLATLDGGDGEFQPTTDEELASLKAEAKQLETAAKVKKETAKLLKSMRQTPPGATPVPDLDPQREAFEASIFGPDDLHGNEPEATWKVAIERQFSAEHQKTERGELAFKGFLGNLPYDECTLERVRDEWGGGRYMFRVHGGPKGRYIGAKSIIIAGLPRNPGESSDDEEAETMGGFAFAPPGYPGFAPGYAPPAGGYGPGAPPPWYVPKEDRTVELFAAMNQQSAQTFQLMTQRMEAEQRREEERIKTEREERRMEAERLSRDTERKIEELRIQAERDRESARQGHELEMKKMEMANADRLKQMELMMTMLKPDTQVKAFTTMFTSVVELVRATTDGNEKSVVSQVLDTVRDAVPAFLSRSGPALPAGFPGMAGPPAIPQAPAGPPIPPEVLFQKFREDAFAQAVQSIQQFPPGYSIGEGKAGTFFALPPGAPVPAGVRVVYGGPQVPATAPPSTVPSPPVGTSYGMSPSLLVAVLQKFHAGAEAIRVPFDLVAEAYMTEATRQRIGQIYSDGPEETVMPSLFQLIASNGGTIPDTFMAQINTPAGHAWIADFLFACQWETYAQALEESQKTGT